MFFCLFVCVGQCQPSKSFHGDLFVRLVKGSKVRTGVYVLANSLLFKGVSTFVNQIFFVLFTILNVNVYISITNINHLT